MTLANLVFISKSQILYRTEKPKKTEFMGFYDPQIYTISPLAAMPKLIVNKLQYVVLSRALNRLGTSKLLVPLCAALRLNTNIYTLPHVAGEIER